MATALTAFVVRALVVLPLPLPDRLRHRRRVRGDQLRDRRADPGASTAAASTSSSTAASGSAPSAARCCRSSRSTRHLPRRRRLAADVRARRRARRSAILLVRRHVPESPRWLFIHGRDEEAEKIVDEHRADGSSRTTRRDAARRPRRRDHDPPAARDRLRARSRRTVFTNYPKRTRARALAVHRPGVPLQRDHLRLRRDPDDLLRRRRRQHRLLLRGHRASATSSARCCSARCSTPSAASR